MQDLAAKVEPLYFENQNIIDALEDLDSNFFVCICPKRMPVVLYGVIDAY